MSIRAFLAPLLFRFCRSLALDANLWRLRCHFECQRHLRPRKFSWRQLYFVEPVGCCQHIATLNDFAIEGKREILKRFQPAAITGGGSSKATASGAAAKGAVVVGGSHGHAPEEKGDHSASDITTQSPPASCCLCLVTVPDLWICFTPGCGHVGCGRTKGRHALLHFFESDEEHPVVMKVHTLEMWCYRCRVWLGQTSADRGEPGDTLETLTEASPLREISALSLEVELVKEISRRLGLTPEAEALNQRRRLERSFNLRRMGEFFLIPRFWSSRWHLFLIGDIETPGPITNGNLLLRLTDHSPEAEPPRLNIHYSVVMGEAWAHFAKVYDAGPPIPESLPELRKEVVAELRELRRLLDLEEM